MRFKNQHETKVFFSDILNLAWPWLLCNIIHILLRKRQHFSIFLTACFAIFHRLTFSQVHVVVFLRMTDIWYIEYACNNFVKYLHFTSIHTRSLRIASWITYILRKRHLHFNFISPIWNNRSFALITYRHISYCYIRLLLLS